VRSSGSTFLQRAASGQLRRISPSDLSESPSESPASSRAPSAGYLRCASGSAIVIVGITKGYVLLITPRCAPCLTPPCLAPLQLFYGDAKQPLRAAIVSAAIVTEASICNPQAEAEQGRAVCSWAAQCLQGTAVCVTP